MSEVIVQENIQTGWSLGALKDYIPEKYFAPAATHSLVLCSALVVLQIIDAILTLSGVSAYGIEAEGNPLLYLAMTHIGALPTIVIAKTLAIGIIGVLFTLSLKVAWVPKALYGIIGVYLFCAVIPWSYLLLTF